MSIKKPIETPDLILLIDKPLTWTSFDAVKKIRGALKIKKVGHAGTLDPLATGLLIVCTGKNTKKIDQIMADEKTYTGTITLGHTTPSFDLETELENEKQYSHLSETDIRKMVQQFLGTIEQYPPIHSAIRINGKRAYAEARLGNEVVMKSREVFIKSFEITNINLPHVDFCIKCSKGTYIRSIANDFGAALGCGGHLSALRRTHIGTFDVKDAYTIEQFVEKYSTHANTL
jgi:tRNA pseudouridine55 synthase